MKSFALVSALVAIAMAQNNNNGGGGTPNTVNQASPYSVLYPPAAANSASDAFSNFAQHVYAVSSTIMGLSSATSPGQIQAMANVGYVQEALEKIEAMKMASLTNNNGGAALQSLVANTPCVLNGLQMAAQAQTPQMALQVAQQMSIVRDSTILPMITALGSMSGAQNLLQFGSTGPMLAQPVQVEQSGSQKLLAAQQALGCAPGQGGNGGGNGGGNNNGGNNNGGNNGGNGN